MKCAKECGGAEGMWTPSVGVAEEVAEVADALR
jgi:hypothetical protein